MVPEAPHRWKEILLCITQYTNILHAPEYLDLGGMGRGGMTSEFQYNSD